MKSVWITGCNRYEVSGVVTLLKSKGVAARVYRPGGRFGEGDRLIICLSGVPLLGWWRYLRIMGWLVRRYEGVRFIVLCPAVVYDSGVTDAEDMLSVNGSVDLMLLSESLLRCLRKGLPVVGTSGTVWRTGRRQGWSGLITSINRCINERFRFYISA
ncbi:TPA: hypothetical protein JLP98_003790 [Escherichia coli]|nr:hypothetical protein [Escherichia coli]